MLTAVKIRRINRSAVVPADIVAENLLRALRDIRRDTGGDLHIAWLGNINHLKAVVRAIGGAAFQTMVVEQADRLCVAV